ncbi:Rho termination factor N-terminal domain-containing protein [Endozoicomonas sp. ALB091]|uniref:Rho termination factor N-terminal domain-containing protein n=1 Tax=Endozoicomonas sp. ALB091 TaxID=3403073 RepID=UPI003BB80B22
MISSKCNLFHSEYASSVTGDSTSETLDTPSQRKGVPAHPASDSLSTRTVEPEVTTNHLGSPGFSSVFFDARSQEYLLLVKAIRVLEKGPTFNDEKIGSVSRKKMTVSQLRQIKNDLKVENLFKLRQLELITNKIFSLTLDSKEEIRQQDIASLLEILSDFYSPDHFINCMLCIMQKVYGEHFKAMNVCRATSITAALLNKAQSMKLPITVAAKHEIGEIVELIFRIVLSKDDMGKISSFPQWYSIWESYFTLNIICSCINVDGSHYCAPYFSPELPVKVALKCFGQLPHLSERENEFLQMKTYGGKLDVIKIQTLHFNLLIGKEVNTELVISYVKESCQIFQHKSVISVSDDFERYGLLQLLHTATVCVLEKSEHDARRLIECYEYFSFMQPSAGVLKNYMQARCEEIYGAVDTASSIYQSLVSGENQVPVFEELIRCLEKMGDNEAVYNACINAADYYRDKGIKWREEFYEHKAVATMMLMIRMDDLKNVDQSPGQDEVDVSVDIKPQAKVSRSKPQQGNRKNRLKRGTDARTTGSRRREKTESAQSCHPPCPTVKLKKDTAHAVHSRTVKTGSSEPASENNERDYWRELNELFLDYYHVPHKYRDAVERLSLEACQFFPNDIWILHSAGWGFHLIGDEKKAAELLLKGLRQYLNRDYPEVKSFIPVDIYGSFEAALDKLKVHPDIMPGSSAGLNVAAYLSSLAYVYRNFDNHYDAQMRSLANWLNPAREARKKEKLQLAFTPKVNVITAEVGQIIKKSMVFDRV